MKMANLKDVFGMMLSDIRSGDAYASYPEANSDVEQTPENLGAKANDPDDAALAQTSAAVMARPAAEKKNPVQIAPTPDQLMQGIILSEILAKPVSRRRHLR